MQGRGADLDMEFVRGWLSPPPSRRLGRAPRLVFVSSSIVCGREQDNMSM
ncbi:hypothetical protein DAI22_12g131700 [Oryza sativa Japonica Group]|nr:hypothetical protein DAI22_12g131700 [Oryza sativa Japonica Group]